MKNQTLTAFLTGAGTASAALYAAGSTRPVLSALFGAAIALGARYCVCRASTKPGPDRPRRPGVQPTKQVRRKSMPRAAVYAQSPREIEIVSALVNFGAEKRQARFAARLAIAAAPGASLEDQIREAVDHYGKATA